jgi:LysR family transcriptional regulator, transcriptional activator of nhaA
MEWLNYHHLRYFWVVAQEGNLARASERLHVSQPSISEQIRELEEAMGERLFRREGRGKALTEVGQMVLGYANEIFALGEELMSSVKGQGAGRIIRLNVGIVDSLPKLLTNRILKPVFDMKQPVHVICREGKLEDLLPQLGAHRLDLVLADEPSAGDLKSKTFNHRLGASTLTLCAAPVLARTLKRRFPKSLNEAPALLPAANTSLRRSLEKWFQNERITPKVLAEFDDLALMKALAADGRGFIALPTAAFEEARNHYGFMALGLAGKAREHFYAITAERRMSHPAVTEITNQAHDELD